MTSSSIPARADDLTASESALRSLTLPRTPANDAAALLGKPLRDIPRTADPDAATDPLTMTDHLLIVINVLGLALASIDAIFDLGPWSAYACVLITSALYLAHVTWRKKSILTSLLLFGLAGGLTELAADWWLVSVTGTLQYAQWGPFLVDSPAYMPMSWAGILLSMGYFGWFVQRKYGMAKGILFATLLTGVYVPTFEALAHYAEWWTYSNCAMLGPVPWYIIVGEALIGMALVPLVSIVLDSRSVLRTALAGVAAGLWIWVAYFIAMLVT